MLRLSQNASDLFANGSSSNVKNNTIIKLAIEFESMGNGVSNNHQQIATSNNSNNRHGTLLELVFLNLYFNLSLGKVLGEKSCWNFCIF
jgi:hypothetical protein